MFVTEPIVLFLSLPSGFSNALLFTFLEGFTPVLKQWGFKPHQVGLAFVSSVLSFHFCAPDEIAKMSFLTWMSEQ